MNAAAWRITGGQWFGNFTRIIKLTLLGLILEYLDFILGTYLRLFLPPFLDLLTGFATVFFLVPKNPYRPAITTGTIADCTLLTKVPIMEGAKPPDFLVERLLLRLLLFLFFLLPPLMVAAIGGRTQPVTGALEIGAFVEEG